MVLNRKSKIALTLIETITPNIFGDTIAQGIAGKVFLHLSQ